MFVSLIHTHTHTHTRFLLLTPISSSLNPRLAFRSAGSQSMQQLTPPYLQPRNEKARKRERKREKISFSVTSPPLSYLRDGDSACFCYSLKTTDKEMLMTIRTCSQKNNRSISGSCSSHAYLCFSLSRKRKRKEREGWWSSSLQETFEMNFYNMICYRLETMGGGYEKQPP